MSTAVKIQEDLYEAAKTVARREHRSTAGQVTYWAKLGKIAEENSDLPLNFIKDILTGLEEAESGNLEDYDVNEP